MRLKHFAALLVLGLSSLTTPTLSAQEQGKKMFGKDAPFTVAELPAGKLKTKLQTLDPEARGKAMQWLHSFSFGEFDAAHHLRADAKGGIFYICADHQGHCDGHHHGPVKPGETPSSEAADPTTEEAPVDQGGTTPEVAGAAVPVSSPPAYNSKPGATRHIYIDFNGALVSGKAWSETDNKGTTDTADDITWNSWDCDAWSSDGDRTTFSDTEQLEMRRIWERIAEDYAPFDVNVTTDVTYDPATYTGDKNKVGWLLVTPITDKLNARCPHYGAGGVAYVGVYGNSDYFSTYQPAWVTPMGVANTAEAASHEMGHNMGLSHDGLVAPATPATYYGGHAGTTSAPSWGPIMGTGYGQNVSQWSKGEYYGASQLQDDLSIINGRTPYRTDDHGGTNGTASTIVPTGGGAFSRTGIIETTSEVDVFGFSTGAGSVTVNANTYRCANETWGGNLDVNLELYNSGGTLVASHNPAAEVNASITATLAAGTYFIHVKSSAAGTPTVSGPSGYTVYGSVGQYTVSGNFILPGVNITEAGGTNVVEGGATDTYTISLGTAPTANVTVSISPNAQVATSTSSVTFTTANWSTPQTVTITAANDAAIEGNHTGLITHSATSSDPSFNGISIGSVIVNITDNDDIVLTTPNGGESWMASSTQNITWTSLMGGNVKLELLRNGSLDSVIIASTPNDGTHSWTIPSGQFPTTDYRVRISSVETPASLDTSLANFTVSAIPSSLASQNFDAASTLPADWSNTTASGTAAWTISTTKSHTPTRSAFVSGPAAVAQANLTSAAMAIPSGSTGIQFSFYHDYNIENGWDGGLLEFSIDGGPWFDVISSGSGASFGQNGYTLGSVPANYGNPIGNRSAWSGSSGGFIQTIVNLTDTAKYAGKTLRARWIFGSDDAVASTGWYVDTVELKGIPAAPTVGVVLAQSGGSTNVTEGGATDTYTVKLISQPTANVTMTVTPNSQVSVSPSSLSFTTTNWATAQTITVTAVNDSANEFAHTGNINHTLSSADVAYNNLAVEAVVVNITDNDNIAPVVNAGTDQSIALTGTVWSPADVGPLAWYDANDAATVTQVGGAVSQWADKAGTSHMVQATGTKQPVSGSTQINGLNSIAFDGTDDALKTATNPFGASISNAMLMGVFNIGTITNSTLFSLSGSSSSRWQSHAPYGEGTLYFDCGGSGGVNRISGASGFTASQNRLLGYYCSITDNVQQVWVDGTNTLSDATGHTVVTSSGIAFGHDGASSFDNCRMGEVLVINSTVTAVNRQKLEGYLAHKWGLAGSLPAGHPYKTTGPNSSQAVANLDGTASDANLDPLTYAWSVVSGPGAVVFGNAAAIDTNATFTVEGTYTLRLTASDSGAQVSDDVVITVGPSTTDRAVTYNGNGNTGGSVPVDGNSPYTNGSTVTVLGNTGALTRTGYTFSNWNTAANGTGTAYAPGATFNISAATTLYAQWTGNTYTVTFTANGGNAPSQASKSVTIGSTYGTLATISRTGYTFAGWFTAATGGTLVTAATTVTNPSNHPLFAQWTANTYTVTFNGNNGGTPSPATTSVTYGSPYGPLATVTRAGYSFTGWFTASSGGTQVTSSTTVAITLPQTLYAQWTVNAYTITFDSAGGSAVSPITQNFGTVITAPAAPTRAGYTFTGWNPAVPATMPAGNLNVTAQWTANTYTVTFDANEGGAPSPTSKAVTYNSAYGTLSAVTRVGYSLNGWFTAASGGTQVTSGTIVSLTTNHILYAQWTQNFPEMDVTRSGSPKSSGGYDSVSGTSAGTGAALTYVITNSGTGDLTLGSPALSGQSNCAVVINTAPATTVAQSGTTNLALTVTPTAAGAWSFQLSIASNDSNENPYQWMVHGVAQASATTSFTATADTYINGASPGSNNGILATFSIYNRSNGSNYRYGFLKFDLSSIPAGATVSSATLDFVKSNATAGSVDIYEAAGAWTETGATWTNSNTLVGITPFGTAAAPATANAAVPGISLNTDGITKVQSWVTTPSGNNGFGVKTTNSGNGANIDLHSREATTVAYRPKLTVTYTYTPQVSEMHVTRAGLPVADAATDPIPGTTAGTGSQLTYTIANLGNANLTLTTPVSVSGVSNCSVVVNTAPATTVSASTSTSLLVTVTPTAAGAWSANLSITNNDPNENPYNWIISGTAAGGYTGWAGGTFANGALGNHDMAVDSDNDGLATGVEWVVGGDPTFASDSTSKKPNLDNTTDPNYVIYTFRRSDLALADPKTVINVEYCSDLTGWTNAVADGSNIIITPSNDFYGAGVDKVEVKLKRTLAPSGKLFTRLKVVINP